MTNPVQEAAEKFLEARAAVLPAPTDPEAVSGELMPPSVGAPVAIVYAPKLDEDLSAGMKTLAGELLDDAIREIRKPQASIEQKKYAAHILGHVSKVTLGVEALKLKASQEGRENAGFLMSLLARAAAGTITDAELALLERSYQKPQTDEQG